jgi:hypothetical protein
MTMFNEREQAFEAKFAQDETFRFLVTARRDKLFAHWAGERLGVPGEEIEAMTAAALSVRDGPGHDERMLAHMARVFEQHGVLSERGILAEALGDCAARAKAQMLEGPHFL